MTPIKNDTDWLLAKAEQEDNGLVSAGDLPNRRQSQPREVSLDEELATFRQQVDDSGMSDADLERFFEQVREEVRQDKQIQKVPSVG